MKKSLNKQDQDKAKKLKSIWNAKAKNLRLTQEIAGEELGMSQGAVGHYLNGRNPLNIKITLQFAKLLQCAPQEIDPSIQDLIDLQSASELLGGNTILDLSLREEAGEYHHLNQEAIDIGEAWMVLPESLKRPIRLLITEFLAEQYPVLGQSYKNVSRPDQERFNTIIDRLLEKEGKTRPKKKKKKTKRKTQK